MEKFCRGRIKFWYRNYKGERPAIIDFYATWCSPCKATAPNVEKIAEEYDCKINNVCKVESAEGHAWKTAVARNSISPRKGMRNLTSCRIM